MLRRNIIGNFNKISNQMKILKELKETIIGNYEQVFQYAKERGKKMNGMGTFLANISKKISQIAMCSSKQ